jgi:hypothetical protein
MSSKSGRTANHAAPSRKITTVVAVGGIALGMVDPAARSLSQQECSPVQFPQVWFCDESAPEAPQ